MSQAHQNAQFARRNRMSVVRIGLGLLIVAILALGRPELPRVYLGLSFTDWHTILEVFSIVICGLVFAVCWNTYSAERPAALLILGCASLGALLLDLVHTLSFVGMPDFATPNTFGKAFIFYVSARLLIALALLAVALLPWQPNHSSRARYTVLFAVLTYVAIIIWAVLWEPQHVPLMETRENAIPAGKVVVQSGLVVLFVAAGLLFRSRMAYDRDFDGIALFEAAMLMALGELAFTQVNQLTDAAFLVGHGFKVLGFMRIYRAIFVQGIQKPFEDLAASQSLLSKSEEALRTVTDNLPALIAFIDHNLIYRFANKNYERWLGLPQGSIVGRSLTEVLGRYHASQLLPRLRRALRGETLTYDYQYTRRATGPSEEPDPAIPPSLWGVPLASAPTWLNITYMPRRGADGCVDGVYVLTLDVTERRGAEEHAAYIARHDELTGLPNRLAFKDALRDLLTPVGAPPEPFAVLFIDLDRFKTVNDTLGHGAGDKLLQVVAKGLRGAVREVDLVARMGGDEMCVLLRDAQSIQYVSEVAQRLMAELKKPQEIAPTILYKVTVSIGIALYPGDGTDGEALLKNADIAMYQAKAKGRDQYCFFQLEAEGMTRRRMELELELQTAVSRGEFALVYQPILDVRSRRPVGMEALIRWQHPTRGQLAAGEFIALAEEMGIIAELGEWVLESAAAALAELDLHGVLGLVMAVNISARQFQSPMLVETVARVLERHSMSPRRFNLELTESAMMDNPDGAQRIMLQLKALGVGLSVDDFGTGYSSLAYLKRFPVDTVKIDRSFVADVPGDRDDSAIATAIIAMGHSLELGVVAEGVETGDQLAFLATQGCNHFQGHLDSMPMTLSELITNLSERTESPLVGVAGQ
jgi:diguanylate cyclase (GGDEF)-like protein/PAS domain S-box-containing protein